MARGSNTGPTMFPAGAQSLLRSMNARAVLELIHREGPIARSDISEATGLSKTTVGFALSSLLGAGVLDETGHTSGRPGPGAVLYRVRPGSALSVGIDIGHDRVHAAIVDISGEILGRRQAPTRRRLTGLVEQLQQLVTELCAEQHTDADQLIQLVVGVPAVVDPTGETLSLGDSLPRDGAGFPQAVRAAFTAPVTFDNDTNLAVLGERARGHGRAIDDFVFLSVGTGLGVGILLGGKLYRGVSGAAGEIGYLPGDDPGLAPTPPRNRAMIEASLSGPDVVTEAAALGLSPKLTGREVFNLARSGDRRALAVVETISHRIAYVISCVTAVLDPGLVVLGGGVGLNQDLLLEPVTRHLRGLSPFSPRIEVSRCGTDAVLFGSVSLASELARDSVFAAASISPTSNSAQG
ncbi:MAG: ROK family protein [Jatrophihabitans sp.]